MIDLSDHIERRQIIAQIENDVDAFCREYFKSEHRTHLGASGIADPCAAKSWGAFRWLKLEHHTGQQLRLFERGHLEESRFVKILRGVGFEVREFDEDGGQFKISGVDGHFGGSLDAMAKFPPRYGISDEIIILNEYKTHSEDSFAKLAGKKLTYTDLKAGKRRTGGDGVRVSKPVHFGQMNSYGRAYGFKYALYVAVNKNTDELYFEIVPLDWLHADDLFRKAETVIRAQTQPPKIALTKTYFGCKLCHLSPICHDGELPEKNCRSCKDGLPIADGKWKCGFSIVGGTLSDETIAVGCDVWTPIINAVEAE